MTNLELIKYNLGIKDNIEDTKISSILNQMEGLILVYIGKDELPKALNSVLVEASLAKYNRNGDEGFASVSIAGSSYSYKAILEEYYPILDKYLYNTKKKWLFL